MAKTAWPCRRLILPCGCPDQRPKQAPKVLPRRAKCRNSLPCNYLINKWESDDKPGSVMRLPAPDRHSSRGTVTRTLKQPTRKAMVGPTTFPIWSCSKRGMPSMPRHRGIWWALTPPFHPYPAARRGGLLSVALSEGRPSWVLPSVLPCGARTFLPGPCGPQRRSVQLPPVVFAPRHGLRCTPAGEKRINRPGSPASGARGLLLP